MQKPPKGTSLHTQLVIGGFEMQGGWWLAINSAKETADWLVCNEQWMKMLVLAASMTQNTYILARNKAVLDAL